MRVILAEKPDIARKIAQAFARSRRGDGYIEAEDPHLGKAVITWVVGHLFEVDTPSLVRGREEEVVKGKIIAPEKFVLRLRRGAKKQFFVIKKLLSRATEVVIATDAGREGELIARETLVQAGWRNWKRTKRLWTSLAPTPPNLRKALMNLRGASEFTSLWASGESRRQADWIFGINASIAAQRVFRDRNTSIGRVQTPVLVMVAKREEERRSFKPRKFWIVQVELEKNGTLLTARVLAGSKPSGEEENEIPEGFRFYDRRRALEVASRIKGNTARVARVMRKRVRERPPLLYNLTDLQRDANKELGFTLRRTHAVAQNLYEKHGIISYPRSESRHMGEDDRDLVRKILASLGRRDLVPVVDRVGKRVFDSSRLTDHHAIIPLGRAPEGLAGDEKKLFSLIEKRFLAAFMGDCLKEMVEVELEVSGCRLIAKGVRVIEKGWRRLYPVREKPLPPLKEDEILKIRKVNVGEDTTKPPPLYTEGALVKLMEKLNLGAPSTRDSIVEVLKTRGYVRVMKGKLVPTEKGMEIYRRFRDCAFASPELTARWERQLEEIKKSRKAFEALRDFIEGIKDFTARAVREILSTKLLRDQEHLSSSARKRYGATRLKGRSGRHFS